MRNTVDSPQAHAPKLAYQIAEIVQATGLGRTTIYEEIRAGRLKSKKIAGRRLVLRSDLEDFLQQPEAP